MPAFRIFQADMLLERTVACCVTEYTTFRYQCQSSVTRCALPPLTRKNTRQASWNPYVCISNSPSSYFYSTQRSLAQFCGFNDCKVDAFLDSGIDLHQTNSIEKLTTVSCCINRLTAWFVCIFSFFMNCSDNLDEDRLLS